MVIINEFQFVALLINFLHRYFDAGYALAQHDTIATAKQY